MTQPKNKGIERGYGIVNEIRDLLSFGEYREVWFWARNDGLDIKESYWLPEGYSPSDLITKRKWNYLKLNHTRV